MTSNAPYLERFYDVQCVSSSRTHIVLRHDVTILPDDVMHLATVNSPKPYGMLVLRPVGEHQLADNDRVRSGLRNPQSCAWRTHPQLSVFLSDATASCHVQSMCTLLVLRVPLLTTKVLGNDWTACDTTMLHRVSCRCGRYLCVLLRQSSPVSVSRVAGTDSAVPVLASTPCSQIRLHWLKSGHDSKLTVRLAAV